MCATHVLLLLGALPALAGVSGAGPELVPPELGDGGAVLAAAGHDVELHCTVLHLGDKSVSWVRSRDLQILSHAGVVFTADSRVSASSRAAGPGASVHALRIARLRLEDAGRYECQLNTEPKTSLLFNLTVLEHSLPVAVVSAAGAGRRVRADAGGSATLACEAQYEPAGAGLALPPLQIRWTRGTPDTLEPVGSRGGVSVEAERWAGGARSSLTLGAVRAQDAGQYWCWAGDARAQLYLQVLDTAAAGAAEAMQGDAAPGGGAGGGARARGPPPTLPLTLTLLYALCVVRARGP